MPCCLHYKQKVICLADIGKSDKNSRTVSFGIMKFLLLYLFIFLPITKHRHIVSLRYVTLKYPLNQL